MKRMAAASAILSSVMCACSGAPLDKTIESRLTVAAQKTGPVNIWIIRDSGVAMQPLEAEFDCLLNHTDFNDIISSWATSTYRSTPLLWDPAHGHGGSTTVAAGSCGAQYAPNPQCLINAVMNDPHIGAPRDGDVFLYIVHGPCGGGNNNGGTNGAPVTGTQVTGPNGAMIHIISGTVGDGTGGGDNFPICQQRVAAHEAFESTTDVSGADCCTGQTPGNLCDNCDPSCAKYNGPGPDPVKGPIGWGSHYISCGGNQYVSQLAINYAGGNSEWVPGSCRAAAPKEYHPRYYAAQFNSQSFAPSNVGFTMTVNQKLAAWIEMKNIGYSNWDSNTKIATTQPRDRTSAFAAADWLAANRLGGCGGGATPNSFCTFKFTLQAPNTPGDYDEYFGMVQEGTAWFSDATEGGPADNLLRAKIKVVEADYHAQLVAHSYGAGSAATVTVTAGVPVDGWVDLKNVGLQTWKGGVTRLAPTPREMASAVATAAWLSPTRASTVAADVPPGGVGRFALSLGADTVGSWTQTFGVIEEGVTWFADAPAGGGPADGFLTLTVNVVPADGGDGFVGGGDDGAAGGPADLGHGGAHAHGCHCDFAAADDGATPSLALLVVGTTLLARAWSRRHRRRRRRDLFAHDKLQ